MCSLGAIPEWFRRLLHRRFPAPHPANTGLMACFTAASSDRKSGTGYATVFPGDLVSMTSPGDSVMLAPETHNRRQHLRPPQRPIAGDLKIDKGDEVCFEGGRDETRRLNKASCGTWGVRQAFGPLLLVHGLETPRMILSSGLAWLLLALLARLE